MERGTAPNKYRDLRVGQRSGKFYRSFFYYDLSDISDYAEINSVQVKIENKEYDYGDDQDNHTISLYGLTVADYFTYAENVYTDFTHIYHTFDLGFNTEFTSGDIISDMQSSLANNWFGLKLQLDDESHNNHYYGSKKIEVWVTYTIPEVQVTVNTNPANLSFSVDGTTYNSQQVIPMEKGTTHNRKTTTPQTPNGVEHNWLNWSDGGAIDADFVPLNNMTLTATFQSSIVDVTVKNDFEYGKINVDAVEENSPHVPGDWIRGTNHSFGAIDQDYQATGEANYFREFNNWTHPTGSNPNRTFNAFVFDGDYVNNTLKHFEYEADNEFLNGGSGGTIKIDGITQSAPYSDYVLETNSISTEAFSQNIVANGRTVTYNFLEWEDGNTSNPRTKTPNDHFDISPKYKGHLVSGNARPTGHNNGRRMAWDNNGGLHMVYEDNGEIWYTYSSNNGSSWSVEKLISDASDANYSYTNPSISTNAWGSGDFYVHALYETVYYSPLLQRDQHIITYSYKLGATGSWESNSYPAGNAFQGTHFSGSEGERPVFSSLASNNIYAAWRNPVSSKITAIQKYTYAQWSSLYEIPNSNNNGYPALAGPLNGQWHIVWGNGNDLKHVQGWQYSIGQWSSVNSLYDGYVFENETPSITINSSTGKLCVTWAGVHYGYLKKEIYYQEYTPGSGSPQPYGNQTVIYSFNVSTNPRGNPSVGYDPAGIINIFYEDSYSTLWSKKKSGSSWSQYYHSSGQFPSTVNNAPRSAAYTRYTSAPYFVKSYYPSSGLSKTFMADADSLAEQPLSINKRFDYLFSEDTSSVQFLSLTLKSSTVNEIPVAFDESNKGNTLRFSGSDDISMVFGTYVNNVDFEGKSNTSLLNIYLVSNKERTLLETYRLDDFKSDEGTKEQTFYYSALEASNGYLEISFDENTPNVINIFEEVDENGILPKTSISIDQTKIPNNFELKQNYPNPFNPVTHISFGLPQASNVSLVVYNVKGQKIKELVSGFQQAGSYEVVFNATGLASGLYFYRIQAGSYTDVKRMLLVK